MTKFALLIGINYRGTDGALRGCINDALDMREYLINSRGYSPENIVLLTDDHRLPTGNNIIYYLSQLIIKSIVTNADELWLHYSGHGSYIHDRDGDEDDRRDETIVPLDHHHHGMITDDIIHDYLAYVPTNCKMYCIFDCCHSGTILDLKYQYRGGERNVVENANSDLRANIIMISGCSDHQTSADAFHYSKWCGAMTTSFLHSYKAGITCSGLLSRMRDFLQYHDYTQYPQLTSTFEMSDDHCI